MSKENKDIEWLHWRMEEYHSSEDDTKGVVDDLDEMGKLERGFSSLVLSAKTHRRALTGNMRAGRPGASIRQPCSSHAP
jgi:hypothetical protein